MPEVARETWPAPLLPYRFHGVELGWREGLENVPGDCPFCGRDGKFSVNARTGLAHCWVCTLDQDSPKGGINHLTFLRLLWRASDERTGNEAVNALAADRGLLHPETLTHWGVVQSSITGAWLVPGYDAEGRLVQLYKRIRTPERWDLRPTSGMGHGIHGVPLFDPTRGTAHVAEGPWDGMALWESLRSAKPVGGVETVATGSEAASLLADANVLAVPNCGAVGEPLKRWLPLLAGRRVVLWFDSDQPHAGNGRTTEGAGFAATKRACRLLAGAPEPPSEVAWLAWGPEGHDPALPHGFDVRDWLVRAGGTVALRAQAVGPLMAKVQPVPDAWLGRDGVASGRAGVHDGAGRPPAAVIEPLACSSWPALIRQWRKIFDWRQSLDDVFSVMNAVALSTEQVGDSQLFLQVIGDAGTGKTKFCDAMLVSKHCFALEHLTGFHSGWKDSSGEDFSLLSRINRKTLITPEGDVVMSSPRFVEIMGQQRRIFDGTSGATYKNKKEDTRWTGLRTPWIMAGTPALMNTDQSRLGDRFLRAVIDQPGEDGRRDILRRVGYNALRSVQQRSNCSQSSIIDEQMRIAYQMTGGFVDWLRDNAEGLIGAVDRDDDGLVDACADAAEFAAILRARPDLDQRKIEVHDTKELPSRLTAQFVRTAMCLGVVCGGGRVGDDEMRRVRKVARDTARGRTMDIASVLARAGAGGMNTAALALETNQPEEKERALLRFLRRIRAVELFSPGVGAGLIRGAQRWRLTPRMRQLWEGAMSDA